LSLALGQILRRKPEHPELRKQSVADLKYPDQKHRPQAANHEHSENQDS